LRRFGSLLNLQSVSVMAKDFFHQTVRTALEQDDWQITDDPLNLSIGEVDLSADLGAEKIIVAERRTERIAVEVKNFVGQSLVSEFHKALGQYINYRLSMQLSKADRVLYLAVPEPAWTTFFQRPFVLTAIQVYQIKLIIFDPNSQIIVRWIK
jgi:Holliday junction resolvase-like predicted endonuclease